MELLKIETKSDKQTQEAAKLFAKEILKTPPEDKALVVGLEGDLGAGKTVFAKGFAKGLGIKEIIQSPTFVLLKIFNLRTSEVRSGKYRHFIHIDAYRIERAKEIKDLGWEEFLADPKNIILIEWSDKVESILPKKRFDVRLEIINKHIRALLFSINF